jgi:hypothetical protein
MAEESTRVVRPINRANLSIAESVRTVWHVTAPIGTKPDDLLDPAYWAQVSREFLRVGAIIEVVPEDQSWFSELRVMAVGPVWASVALLRHVNLAEAPTIAVNPKFAVGWGGPVHKFRVTRTTDQEILSKGHATAADAEKWLADYARTVGV